MVFKRKFAHQLPAGINLSIHWANARSLSLPWLYNACMAQWMDKLAPAGN